MDVLIVCESVFGNTRVIAEEIANGVCAAGDGIRVAVLGPADATPARTGEAALVIAGGPTHMLGMSRPASRSKALQARADRDDGSGEAAALGARSGEAGIREWLTGLPRAATGAMAASFDTRLPSRLAGGAAPKIARRLRRLGYRIVASPAGFLVDAAEGPLRPGERERARAWGAALARELAGQPVPR
ncbi:MAG: flavodoxin [Actinobacteria bacterium]|nr:flavodoxin [Actinomycetota bacterium]MBO0787223.1 flavodoxin [Actinomycetota bacterium]